MSIENIYSAENTGALSGDVLERLARVNIDRLQHFLSRIDQMLGIAARIEGKPISAFDAISAIISNNDADAGDDKGLADGGRAPFDLTDHVCDLSLVRAAAEVLLLLPDSFSSVTAAESRPDRPRFMFGQNIAAFITDLAATGAVDWVEGSLNREATSDEDESTATQTSSRHVDRFRSMLAMIDAPAYRELQEAEALVGSFECLRDVTYDISDDHLDVLVRCAEEGAAFLQRAGQSDKGGDESLSDGLSQGFEAGVSKVFIAVSSSDVDESGDWHRRIANVLKQLLSDSSDENLRANTCAALLSALQEHRASRGEDEFARAIDLMLVPFATPEGGLSARSVALELVCHNLLFPKEQAVAAEGDAVYCAFDLVTMIVEEQISRVSSQSPEHLAELLPPLQMVIWQFDDISKASDGARAALDRLRVSLNQLKVILYCLNFSFSHIIFPLLL